MKNENIEKPLGLVRKELREKIVTAINESGLPLSMTAYILKDILEEVNVTVIQQDKKEIAEYQQEIEQAQAENKDKK